MEKAARALSSSRSLLAEGDTDGACNRAYYAMFNAARAALIASDAPPEAARAKTHSGLQASFNLETAVGAFQFDENHALSWS